jgi:RNA polymerase sigma-70 factor (ECF subfamily)
MTSTDTLTYPVWQNAPAADAGISELVAAEPLADASSSTDIVLAQAAASGNMPAFEELYNRHHRRVYSLCLRMLQNTAEAEDLTQEVFIQLYRKIGSFRGDWAFTTWIHRLTFNLVLINFRKRTVNF